MSFALGSYWVWFGSISLVFMSWESWRGGVVDVKRDYFMLGLTFSLFQFFPKPLWWVLVALLGAWFVTGYLSRLKLFGGVNVSSFNWVIIGFAIINLWTLVVFFLTYFVLGLMSDFIKNVVLKVRGAPVPYYVVLLFSFLFVGLTVGLY